MNNTWYENEIVRIDCQYCQKKFQTRIKVNGHTKSITCRACKKIINDIFTIGTEYSIEKMNKAIEKCYEARN